MWARSRLDRGSIGAGRGWPVVGATPNERARADAAAPNRQVAESPSRPRHATERLFAMWPRRLAVAAKGARPGFARRLRSRTGRRERHPPPDGHIATGGPLGPVLAPNPAKDRTGHAPARLRHACGRRARSPAAASDLAHRTQRSVDENLATCRHRTARATYQAVAVVASLMPSCSSQRSASIAALQPSAAAVIAWR